LNSHVEVVAPNGLTAHSNIRRIMAWETASVVKWSKFLATDPEIRVRFPALPDFLRSSGFLTGSVQHHEYN
jgi:hypothetical protein